MIPGKQFPARSLLLLLLTCLLLGSAFAEPQKTGEQAVDFRQIKDYAWLANAAYQPEQILATTAFPAGYSLTGYHNHSDLNIAYFIAVNQTSGSQIIAVRGTDNVDNALVDIALRLQPDKQAGIKLHSGFAFAARSIYEEIKPLLDPEKTVHTTGHSLGGAVALILAMYLDRDNFKLGQVITFGQPKVSNIRGSETYQHLRLLRIVTPLDLVPIVPPLDPLDIHNLDIYWHGGTEIVLNQDNSYSTLQGINSMLRATSFTQQMLNEQNLNHHQMSVYLDLIDRKTEQSKQVPFINNFNLFNLFGD